ncbi:MAG TPA: hypothetical protein VGO47_04700, partial [Chlamydiales bacterium]|nr:hypothetical protein [Chlamydiales bacterium]
MSQQNSGQEDFFYNGSSGIHPIPVFIPDLNIIKLVSHDAIVTKVQWAKCRQTLLQHEFLIIHLLELKSGQGRRRSIAVIERHACDRAAEAKAELVLNEESSESSKDKTTNAKSFFIASLSHSTTKSSHSLSNSLTQISRFSPSYKPAGDYFLFSYDGTDKFVGSSEGPHEI